ncbi:MAG: class I SAM-dependent methyltransferase, partial [bacterium]|nr:class I SAM-dependent methyltransferase [bacterium]
FDYVVLFFLFHELPYEKKIMALREAGRVLRPGGKIVFGEFHRPDSILLRFSGRIFFSIFEKYAREMWGEFNPATVLDGETPYGWDMSVETFFFGNYQVFSAEKLGPGDAYRLEDFDDEDVKCPSSS